MPLETDFSPFIFAFRPALVSLARLILILSVSLCGFTQGAEACRADKEFGEADIDGAEIVFRGRLVKYVPFQVKYHAADQGTHKAAIMTFDIHKMYKGDKSLKTIEVIWWSNWVFAPPSDFSEFANAYGQTLLVGAVKAEPKNFLSSTLSGGIPTLPEIVQDLCAPVGFVFEYSQGHITDRTTLPRGPTGFSRLDDKYVKSLEAALKARGLLD
jgi:hypothetical protein